MAINIDEPVKQGEDLVINEGGDQHLGGVVEFEEKAAAGLLTGIHFDAAAIETAVEDVVKRTKRTKVKVVADESALEAGQEPADVAADSVEPTPEEVVAQQEADRVAAQAKADAAAANPETAV